MMAKVTDKQERRCATVNFTADEVKALIARESGPIANKANVGLLSGYVRDVTVQIDELGSATVYINDVRKIT
jgi:hypothetical protein